jgi:hypothetical protein
MPTRHGLIKVVMQDTKLLPRILVGTVPGRVGIVKILGRDVELRWMLLMSLIGAYVGFFGGREYSTMYSMRWILAIGAAVVLNVLYMMVAGLAHTAKTRRLGIHGQRPSLA